MARAVYLGDVGRVRDAESVGPDAYHRAMLLMQRHPREVALATAYVPVPPVVGELREKRAWVAAQGVKEVLIEGIQQGCEGGHA